MGVRRCVKDLIDEVLLLEPCPLHPATPTGLGAESIGLDRLYVTRMGERDDYFLVLDEVLDEKFARIVHDAGPTRLRVLLPDSFELRGDHGPQPGWVTEDCFKLSDRLSQLCHLGLKFAATEPRQSAEGHVQDVVRLLLAEGERLGHKVRPSLRTVSRRTNRRNYRVEHVDGPQQALDDVGAGKRLAEPELRAPRDDLHLVGHVSRECLGQIEETWYPVDKSEHVHAEGGLQGRVLVEVVQHDIGVRVALECDHET